MSAHKTVSVWLVEDDIAIGDSFMFFLNKSEAFRCITFRSGTAYREALKLRRPDVVLMDIGLPDINGLDLVRSTKIKYPQIEIIMLTVHSEDDLVFDALFSGASGYILKDSDLTEIVRSIEEVLKGGAPMSTQIARMVIGSFQRNHLAVLSTREREVLMLLSDGLSYKMISTRLSVSIDTVRSHIKNLYRKLNVNSNLEAISIALRSRNSPHL